MKRLVFKKWLDILNNIVCALGLFIMCAFEWPTFTPYIIGLLMFGVSGILGAMYGRD